MVDLKHVVCGFCGRRGDSKAPDGRDIYFVHGSAADICEPCIDEAKQTIVTDRQKKEQANG